MVANVVVSQAAVGGLSFGLSCRRLVRWRQRLSCARVRDRARAWARAQVVHRTTGTKVQAQEQIWEDRAREHKSTGAQRHRGTGTGLRTRIEDWASRFLLPWGSEGRGARLWFVALCSWFLSSASAKHSRTARRTCVQVNTSLHTIMPSHCETCPFFCAGGWWMSTLKAVRKKKTTGHEVPLFTALMLASSARERDSPGGNASVQEARGCAWEAARRTCFSHVSFSSGSFFWRAACIELAGVVECFSRSTFPRAHLVLRWHTNTCIHMLQVAHSLHMFFGGGT